MKGEKMIKNSSFSRMRKRLSDITNLNSQHKSPFKNQENAVPAANDAFTKNYMDQIVKENSMMTKIIQEKDKIIETNVVELQTLRVNLQRTQLQNYQLAQANSQMLAELNMAKDRFRTLQHEFVCKDALFKAMSLQLKEGDTKPEVKPESKREESDVEQPPAGESYDENEENKVSKVENKISKTKRGRPAKSRSMGPTTSQQAGDKDLIENKRHCLRRESMRLKPSEKQDKLFEIDVANNSIMDSNSRRKSSSDVVSDNEECCSEPSKHAQARLSIGRPQRRATEKVQSYKDPPLNTKMRRPMHCLRRESMRLKPSEKQDKLFEIDVANNSIMDSNSRRKSSSDVVSDNEECCSEPSKHAQARLSIGRPQRRATEKVQSYKDPPLNTKMRRPM